MKFSTNAVLLAVCTVLGGAACPARALNIHCNSTRSNALAYPLNPAITDHDALPFSFFLIDGLWCDFRVWKTCGDWTAAAPANLTEWSHSQYPPIVQGNPLCEGATFWLSQRTTGAENASSIHLTLANGTRYECAQSGNSTDDVQCDASAWFINL